VTERLGLAVRVEPGLTERMEYIGGVRRWYGMAESNALTRQFDDAAQLYDEVRPRYPEPIVEQIIAFAALPAHGRIFEVGCGTGQMTLPFAQRGYRQALCISGQFGELQEVRTSWARRYSGEDYIKLLWTSSDHRAMPEPHRSRFIEAIRRVIAQMGGEVIRDYETLALLAKKS
jgi:SAM-dependent methyltransferase